MLRSLGAFTPFRTSVTTTMPGSLRVCVEGEVDLSTIGELADCLAAAREAASSRLAIDLRGVTFMGSSGINLLADELPRAIFAGARVDVQTTPAIDRLLRLARFIDPFAAWSLSPIPQRPGDPALAA